MSPPPIPTCAACPSGVRRTQPGGMADHRAHFPDSLIVEYVRREQHCCSDYSLLNRIINERVHRPHAPAVPSRTTLVIHIRTGDVVDFDEHADAQSVLDMLSYPRLDSLTQALIRRGAKPNHCYHGPPDTTSEWPTWRARPGARHAQLLPSCGYAAEYVQPLQYYMDRVRALPAEIDRVAIVSGSHWPLSSTHHSTIAHPTPPWAGIELGSFDRSWRLLSTIKAFFEEHGYPTSLRTGQSPDEDIIFMSRAAYFIPADGGFSATVAQLARRRGATIFGLDLKLSPPPPSPKPPPPPPPPPAPLSPAPPIPAAGVDLARHFRHHCRAPSLTTHHFNNVVHDRSVSSVFLDNVKAGSTSVREWMSHHIPGENWTLWSPPPYGCQLHHPSPAPQPRSESGCFSSSNLASRGISVWSIAREPFSKFESGVRQAYSETWRGARSLHWFRERSADELLRSVISHPGVPTRLTGSSSWHNEHFQPSTYRLSGYGKDGNVLWPDHIYRLEEPGFWDKILRDLFPPPIPQAALPRSNHHGQMSDALEAKSRLSEHAKRQMCDSELYGYEWACLGYARPHFCSDYPTLKCCRL